MFENNPTFPEQGHWVLLIQGRLCYESHLQNKPLKTDLNISFTCVFHPFVPVAASLCAAMYLFMLQLLFLPMAAAAVGEISEITALSVSPPLS